MFKIESYVTPILLSYVDKYVRDFKPADAQVSLWGGGVALHNLVLKADVLQQEVSLPFTLVSGRIHELLIQVPWTKIMSEPIVVTIDTIECVLSLTPPATDGTQTPESPSRKTTVVEAPPGYMQALVRRIVSNIALRVHHLIVKYVQDDIVLSLNVKHVAVDSAGVTWEPAFADIDPLFPVIRRLVRLDDLTLCLDRADSDGKIRYYQEPLLYRCQLNFRVSTKLVSANTRRATSLAVELRSSKLAFGVTNDQLVLLIRLLRERSALATKQPPPAKAANAARETPLHISSSNSAEPARQESWSEWAWSWLPTWMDKEGGVEEAPIPPTPIPAYFTAYLDDISLVYKTMEIEPTSRKRARSILEFSATHAAIKSTICSPTTLRVRFGARLLTLCSHGKCVCGQVNYDASRNLPTIYIKKATTEEEEKEWEWPEEDFSEQKVERAQMAEEEFRESPEPPIIGPDSQQSQYRSTLDTSETNPGQPEQPQPPPSPVDEADDLWQQLAPVLFVEFTHERSHPDRFANPYDSPPQDFEYSDWVELCKVKVKVEPMELRICMGLIHRLQALKTVLLELPPVPEQEPVMRTLTVEENEALSDNLPQKRIVVEMRGLTTRVYPVDHTSHHHHHDRSSQPPLLLDVDLPNVTVVLNGPLYPQRVCSAACQLPEDSGPLFHAARLNVSVDIPALQFRILSLQEMQPRTFARTDLKLIMYILLNKEYFKKRQKESVEFAYSFKIRELNISGSAARLQAAYRIPMSLITQRVCPFLRYTTLPADAIQDEDAVALDVTVEDVSLRGYVTRNINTHIMSVQSARATAIHAPNEEETKQAWIFSAPETPSTLPYLRLAVQWCAQLVPNSFDYLGLWTEPTAFAVDPLLVTFLAYSPQVKYFDSATNISSTQKSQFFQRRRPTPPSSSGRGSRFGAELVHMRPRSMSGSEPSEKKEQKHVSIATKSLDKVISNEKLLVVHERLRHMLMNVEVGLVVLYVTSRTASALDCANVREAMERHSESGSVLGIVLGRLTMHSSAAKTHLWTLIRHDGPTFVDKKCVNTSTDEESFPWKLRLADMSCYTLAYCPQTVRHSSIDLPAKGIRSQLKTTGVHPRTMLEATTTTVTLSVVTKSMRIKMPLKTESKKKSAAAEKPGEDRIKYFKGGMDFKPTTLNEFVRGPSSKQKKTEQSAEKKEAQEEEPASHEMVGPVVSVGVHIHADTPPVILRICHDQVPVVASAIHCLQHILALLYRQSIVNQKRLTTSRSSLVRTNTNNSSLPQSLSGPEEVRDSQSESEISENPSELISIFEATYTLDQSSIKMKKLFWFQWVISRATLVVSTPQVRFAFDVDDIISSIDLQEHYNQVKLKVASASIKHYDRSSSEDWSAGVLGGRVLEAREPTDQKEENNFLSITITQAQISNLPDSWKNELHPKMLERKTSEDTMWEVYATLAPLEAVVQPIVVRHMIMLMQQMSLKSFCPLQVQPVQRPAPVRPWQWPFFFVTAGGLRLLVTGDEEGEDCDDTFVFSIGKITVNPHPENPIYRRPINCNDPSWSSHNMVYEGRQYEILISDVSIHSAQFSHIVKEESAERTKAQENPALKWTLPHKQSIVTPVLHPVDISCVFAPAFFLSGMLACGPAVELNLVSDCALEVSIEQLELIQNIVLDIQHNSGMSSCSLAGLPVKEEKYDICPYANLISTQEQPEPSASMNSAGTYNDAVTDIKADSGIDIGTSHSTNKSIREDLIKKNVSVAFASSETALTDVSDYLEVFVTMGMVELSLYVADDDSPEVVALRCPSDAILTPHERAQPVVEQSMELPAKKEASFRRSDAVTKSGSTQSITNTIRINDIANTALDNRKQINARGVEGNLPLLHLTLYQPNLYYWRKKNQQILQVSLFNAWAGLGLGQLEDYWHLSLLSTSKGVPDPVTDIRPALATMKIVTPIGYAATAPGSVRGTVRLDVERPVQVEVSMDRLRRLKGILGLIEDRVPSQPECMQSVASPPEHILYKFRRFMSKNALESITIQTSQISVTGSEGSCGWESASLQLASGSRPERVVARSLVTALLVAAGPPSDHRHVLLHPLVLGVELDAMWEAWRRAEFGPGSHVPTVRASVNVDNITMDLRPEDLVTLKDILELLSTFKTKEEAYTEPSADVSPPNAHKESFMSALAGSPSYTSVDDLSDHYYKDDLRSGAFKIVSGGQLPMAYQVTVNGNSVSWRYPHPRAITRIVAFPIPGQNEEIDCVLELYSPLLRKWMSHTFFKLPVSEPREIKLYVTPPEAAFALIWRFRACSDTMDEDWPVEFNSFYYMPKEDPFTHESIPEYDLAPKHISGVTAEELSGVLRVDSYFAPRLLPRLRLAGMVNSIEINFHNSLPELSKQATELEGYYVSRPLMRSHRVLVLLARHWAINCHLGSKAGSLVLLSGKLSADVLESSTGTIEGLVEEFTVRGATSIPIETGMLTKPRTRVRTTRVHVSLHVPRVRTIQALAKDWLNVINKKEESENVEQETFDSYTSKDALAKAMEAAMEGRVALWVHNSCGSALRIGQEGTDEVVPMGPGARLAYRWRSPTAPKRIRFAVAGPSADWHWSNSVPFVAGATRVRLEEGETLGDGKVVPGSGVYIYVRVEDSGATRSMHLVGRLTLANMLRHDLLYKVRARCSLTNQWRGVCSGELKAESVGRTVISGADCDMVLKIKFLAHETGWSGDIPLKECPKENVPWLVKVPSAGDIPYTSVWCRVTRARSDGRVLATLWPLYVLHSHLPLDTDVMISTSTVGASSTELTFEEARPLVQSAPGRGASTHLVAPGTTSARHSLSFQYRNIECPVTREAVPMHYGVTDSSVFDKRAPVNNIDDVIQEVHEWLHRSGKQAKNRWPYSVVTKHYSGTWQPALLQPRCDVTIRYQAVRAGGGCSLEIQLCPVVLLCNAASIALTLRAHDAAPLCKLEPGTAISLPSAVLKKPFFMSVEVGRETFVSGQLELSNTDPGRYGAPPPGKLAVDHAADFAILCNQKVALLTMYYEIKEEINVLGASSTFVILNRLGQDLLVSAVTMSADLDHNIMLRNPSYKLIPPTKPDSVHGTSLSRFWLRGRWRGNSPAELRSYICVALPARSGSSSQVVPAHDAVPIRLADSPMSRRAVPLIDSDNTSMPIVVTQMKQDGRWLVSVARDPCPQFVVHNRTRTPLTIAQPVLYHDEPSTSLTVAERECDGTRWWCTVPPGAITHYSTPAHCARYPPPAMPRASELPFVTFARAKDEGEPTWCPAVVAADGEQLLQLQGSVTMKLRVRTNPHSTLLELQDVDHTDLSASDIRKRLFGPFSSDSRLSSISDVGTSSSKRLSRVAADARLLNPTLSEPSSITQEFPMGQEMGLPRPRGISIASVDDDIKPMPLGLPSSELGVIKNPTKSNLEMEDSESNDDLPVLESEQEREKRASVDVKEVGDNQKPEITSSDSSFVFHDLQYSDWRNGKSWPPTDRARCVIDAIVVELAATSDAKPLLALHADRVALHVLSQNKRTKTTLTISDVQIDNLQYDSGQFDFGVVASTRHERLPSDRWPPVWNIFADREGFRTRRHDARLTLALQHDRWTVAGLTYNELTEVEMSLGPLALYVEDAYVSALVALWRLGVPGAPLSDTECALADERILQCPLRLRSLHLRPLDLTLTLHTAVRMYIALDQSPLRLTAFRLQDMMTSPERLTHALTVHYLSAAILGAGWVVGGLELLGAPGALAARLGEASGGVRGIVSATAAALLRSLSAWAGSLARNLDLLAGDEEHARRAAAARRRPPQTFMAGLAAGITNFAINILGAVGGLAHHPLVGVAVGETESGAAALRRGLVGALTKPLSATADLVAYAGHGLLSQTGWDPIPQPRESEIEKEERSEACWRRDCVRWCFRLCELHAVSGFEVLLDNAPLQLLFTHKFLVVADPESERIMEMIDFRFCSVGPYQGAVIELHVSQRRSARTADQRPPDEDDEYQITAAAMARVARYTGAESAAGADARVLALMASPARAHALYAAFVAAIHHNAETHFCLL